MAIPWNESCPYCSVRKLNSPRGAQSKCEERSNLELPHGSGLAMLDRFSRPFLSAAEFPSPAPPRFVKSYALANALHFPAVPLRSAARRWSSPAYSAEYDDREHLPYDIVRARSRTAGTHGRRGDGWGPRDWDKSANPERSKLGPRECYTNFHSRPVPEN